MPSTSAAGQQQQYDVSYTQCMYSKGNSVQSAPPGAAYAGGYPVYGGYPAYGGYYGSGVYGYGPSVIIGGGGWGWGGYRGYGYGYRGYGYGGYRGGWGGGWHH